MTDEIRTLTLTEAKALPGMLGRIAPAMLERHGEYGFVDTATNRRILLRLVKRTCYVCELPIDSTIDWRDGPHAHCRDEF